MINFACRRSILYFLDDEIFIFREWQSLFPSLNVVSRVLSVYFDMQMMYLCAHVEKNIYVEIASRNQLKDITERRWFHLRHASEIDNEASDFLVGNMDEDFVDNALQVGRLCRMIGDNLNETYAFRRNLVVLIIPWNFLFNICSTTIKMMALICRINFYRYWR